MVCRKQKSCKQEANDGMKLINKSIIDESLSMGVEVVNLCTGKYAFVVSVSRIAC